MAAAVRARITISRELLRLLPGRIVTLNFAREGLANLSTVFTVPGGGGSGDDAFDWATVGDTSLVPTAKLGTGAANANHVLIGNQDLWARAGEHADRPTS